MVKLTLLPFRDHSATLAITFAIADTKLNNLGFPFIRKYGESIDTEHLQLILKFKTNFTANLPNIIFLMISYKQLPFYSKVYNQTVKKHNNIPGNHIRVFKLPPKEITNQPQITTFSTGIPSLQLL